MKKNITLTINEELLERLKVICIIKSTTIDNLIECLIKDEIEKSRNLWKLLEIDKKSDNFDM